MGVGGVIGAGVGCGVALLVLSMLANRKVFQPGAMVKYGIVGMTGLGAATPFLVGAFRARSERSQRPSSTLPRIPAAWAPKLGQEVPADVKLVSINHISGLKPNELVAVKRSDGTIRYGRVDSYFHGSGDDGVPKRRIIIGEDMYKFSPASEIFILG
jgi:hypothetical protein